MSNETNVSAVENTAQTNTWIPGPHEHAGRPIDSQAAACAGPRETECVISISDTQEYNDSTVAKPSFSFPRHNRLHLHRQYTYVFQEGKRYRGNLLTIVVSRSEDGEGMKAGFVVRKKVFKRAVDRNRMKRRMRELVRLNREEINSDVWIVVMAEAAGLKARWDSLSTEFKQLCLKAGIESG